MRRREFLSEVSASLSSLFLAQQPIPDKTQFKTSKDSFQLTEKSNFWWQAASEGKGFFVQGAFLSAVENLGGIDTCGYPISQRWQEGEIFFQAFQKLLIFQEPGKDPAIFPLLEHMSKQGLDDLLEKEMQVPKKSEKEIEVSPVFYQIYERLGGRTVLGGAQSEAFDFGPFVVQRFAGCALQWWKEKIKNMPDPKSITLINIGEFAKRINLFPNTSLIPEYKNTFAPNIFWQADKNLPYCYFTIDDFWIPDLLEKILDIAKEHQVRFALFPVGNVLKIRQDLWQRAVEEGHSIENHTQTHRALNLLSSNEIYWEIISQQESVRKAIGDKNYKQRFLRPPGGSYDDRVVKIANELGYSVALWSADSSDWRLHDDWRLHKKSGEEAIQMTYQNIVTHLDKGTIVLSHALFPGIEALEMAIKEAGKRGLFPIGLRDGLV